MDKAELNEGVSMRPLEPAPVGKPLSDRADRLRIIEEQRRFRPSIYWYLTFRCNLACAHCSVHSSPSVDTSQDLTHQECLRVIDQMVDLNVATALLSGGEFLIRPDALQILEALGQRGIRIGLETNGIHYPPGFVELARDLQSRRLFLMGISLDGGTQETHERLRGSRSFDRTVRGLRLLKQEGIRFDIQCVLNESNYETIPDFYRLASELLPECKSVIWSILSPIGRGIELTQELGLRPDKLLRVFELISKWRATYSGETIIKVPPAIIPPKYLASLGLGSKTKSATSCQFPLLGVLPNGDVTVCALSRDNEALHFGNIRSEGFSLKGVWEKTRMDMLRSRYVAAQDLSGICGDCIWKYTCKGSCRAWSFEEGGSFDAPFPMCQALADSGRFPQAYRLSHQTAAMTAKLQAMGAGAGCGCSP